MFLLWGFISTGYWATHDCLLGLFFQVRLIVQSCHIWCFLFTPFAHTCRIQPKLMVYKILIFYTVHIEVEDCQYNIHCWNVLHLINRVYFLLNTRETITVNNVFCWKILISGAFSYFRFFTTIVLSSDDESFNNFRVMYVNFTAVSWFDIESFKIVENCFVC